MVRFDGTERSVRAPRQHGVCSNSRGASAGNGHCWRCGAARADQRRARFTACQARACASSRASLSPRRRSASCASRPRPRCNPGQACSTRPRCAMRARRRDASTSPRKATSRTACTSTSRCPRRRTKARVRCWSGFTAAPSSAVRPSSTRSTSSRAKATWSSSRSTIGSGRSASWHTRRSPPKPTAATRSRTSVPHCAGSSATSRPSAATPAT